MIRLDYSSIDSFRRCPRLFEYQVVKKLSSETSDALDFGQLIHTALAQFYQGNQEVDSFNSLEALIDVLTDPCEPPMAEHGLGAQVLNTVKIEHSKTRLASIPNRNDRNRVNRYSLEHGLRTMLEYMIQYSNSKTHINPHCDFKPLPGHKTILQELYLDAPLHDITYCGFFDMVAWSETYQCPVLVEHKTAGVLRDKFDSFGSKAKLSDQATGYLWLISQNLKTLGLEETPDTVIYNGIQTAVGKMTNPREKPDGPQTCFLQIPVTRNAWQFAEWEQNMGYWINLIRQSINTETFPQAVKPNCCHEFMKKCGFASICESEPENRKHILATLEPNSWTGSDIKC